MKEHSKEALIEAISKLATEVGGPPFGVDSNSPLKVAETFVKFDIEFFKHIKKEYLDKHELVLFFAFDVWNDIVASADFAPEFDTLNADPFNKQKSYNPLVTPLPSNLLGSISGTKMYTDGFRAAHWKLTSPGEVYALPESALAELLLYQHKEDFDTLVEDMNCKIPFYLFKRA